eukprot:5730493-Amphidinium_carterae.1
MPTLGNPACGAADGRCVQPWAQRFMAQSGVAGPTQPLNQSGGIGNRGLAAAMAGSEVTATFGGLGGGISAPGTSDDMAASGN